MWIPKWLHKQHKSTTEDVVLILDYHINHALMVTYRSTYKTLGAMTLTLHLPSKRVSEKHFDKEGKIIQYIHNSPQADEHIKFLCANDINLAEIIETETAANTKSPYQWWSTNRFHILLGIIIFIIIYIVYRYA